MAGLGLNGRKAASQAHRVNHASPRVNNGHIACRLCGRVCVNTQSLIKHIELHIVGDDMTTSSSMATEPGFPPVGGSLVPNPSLAGTHCSMSTSRANFQGGFMQVPSQGRNPIFRSGSPFVFPPSPPQQMLPPIRRSSDVPKPQFMPVAAGPQINDIDESPSDDGTKPYIQLLEHPILSMRPTGIQSEMSSETVDVTLKL